MDVLEARGVVKQVGRERAARRVLDGVEIEVAGGELVAVLGRSGSGKSTLLHLLGGLDRPQSGSIRVAGDELVGASDRALTRVRLRRIGFVFQSFALVEELSGEENVLLPTRLPGAPGGRRTSSPAASSSASRSPGRSSTTRSSCSPTSRPGTSTRRPRPTSSGCSRGLRARVGPSSS
jgi:ABC-type lipoprotein export system ATPase subunit